MGETISITDKMISAGAAILASWHHFGGDAVVSEEKLVIEIFIAMQGAATQLPQIRTTFESPD